MTQPVNPQNPAPVPALPTIGQLAKALVTIEENEAAPDQTRALAGVFRFALAHIQQIGARCEALAKDRDLAVAALDEQGKTLQHLVALVSGADPTQGAENAEEMPPEPPPVPEPTMPLPTPPVTRRQPKAKPANGAQS